MGLNSIPQFIITVLVLTQRGFPVALVVKSPPAKAGDIRHKGSIPGWERSPGGGHSTPLQYSCLENPMDRGAWRATVHGVTKSRNQLSARNNQQRPSLPCLHPSIPSTSFCPKGLLFVRKWQGKPQGRFSALVHSPLHSPGHILETTRVWSCPLRF